MSTMGFIHSVETCGTLDGPGLRYVVFMQGCALRCKYCHNPDTWQCNVGKQISSDEVVGDILKYRNFIKKGGVTLSGGEPLLQAEFAAEILKGCKKNGLNTCIDTSGIVPVELCKDAINEADLILLDIKHFDKQKCIDITGKSNENALDLLNYCQTINKDVWIRYVLVPGLTDDEDSIRQMADYLKKLNVIKKIEVLPFHKMGEFKWKQLGCNYELENTPEPDKELVKKIKEILL